MARKVATKKNGKNGTKAKGRPVTVRAKVALSETEVAERSERMATVLSEVESQRDALKEYAKAERLEIKEKETEIRDLREAVLHHEEEREVQAEEFLRGSQIVTVRNDTGQVVSERGATDVDKQSDLFGGP